jgi:hypothetical protein
VRKTTVQTTYIPQVTPRQQKIHPATTKKNAIDKRNNKYHLQRNRRGINNGKTLKSSLAEKHKNIDNPNIHRKKKRPENKIQQLIPVNRRNNIQYYSAHDKVRILNFDPSTQQKP